MTEVGTDNQKHFIHTSSSSKELSLESKTVAACQASAASLQELCEKILLSLEKSFAHINNPSTNQFPGDHTTPTEVSDPVHPINALNIQQICFAKFLEREVKDIRSMLGDPATEQDSTELLD